MDQKDNRFQNQETRTHSQGQDRNMYKGHDKSQQTVGSSAQVGISFIVRKAEKLTTALYMVTDIMSEKEPMKWKARETAVELLSDIMVVTSSGSSERMTLLRQATKKIEQVVSFLDVAQSARMMSEMNASVLKKEYVALKDACLVEWQRTSEGSKNIFTESFFEVPRQVEQGGLEIASRSEEGIAVPKSEDSAKNPKDGLRSGLSSGRPDLEEVVRLPVVAQKTSLGHTNKHDGPRSDLGSERSYLKEVGRPNTSEIKSAPTATPPTSVPKVTPTTIAPAFIPRATISPTGIIERPRQEVGRDDRRKIILALIKQKPALTVKDIARSIPGVSEKTIQRELFAMVAEAILTKKGDRRWSTYSLAI